MIGLRCDICVNNVNQSYISLNWFGRSIFITFNLGLRNMILLISMSRYMKISQLMINYCFTTLDLHQFHSNYICIHCAHNLLMSHILLKLINQINNFGAITIQWFLSNFIYNSYQCHGQQAGKYI